MRDIDLVIFDCDGVLIDSETISARMLIAELAERGIDLDMDYVARHFLGRSYPVVLATVRKDFGVDLPESFEPAYRQRLLDAFETELTIMPGVADVIRALDRPYCLATSSSPVRVKRSLEIVGLDSVFAGKVTTASEVANGKPAPDLFLRAAEKMGAQPERCLVIEDSLMGVRAGLAAGMVVWRFTGGSHLQGRALETPDDAVPHREFANFREFFHSDLLSEGTEPQR
ncbi:HAD family phosphatase [Pseudoruegeria sp. HB172150]|uniref:HAD family hydrolase n=1 Tax=Pseudoruegeria sp. HB172150 TaxID=2721164 RepID=UPI0015539074|nr:HAD family hydrolase [Pseudoruegeria sp. HB172150]